MLDTPAARELLALDDAESPVGLLYLGSTVQEQRAPERAPVSEILSFLQ